jgi:hypothetical protein
MTAVNESSKGKYTALLNIVELIESITQQKAPGSVLRNKMYMKTKRSTSARIPPS